MHKIKEEIQKTYTLIDRINKTTMLLLETIPFFEDEDNKQLTSTSNEAAFIYLVVFLYGLYFERGHVNIDFVIEKMQIYGTNTEKIENHKKLVHDLRTYLTHTIKKNKHDQQIKNNCLTWYLEISGKTNLTDADYLKCIMVIMNGAIDMLTRIDECINSILQESEEDLAFIKEEWIVKKSKDYPKYKLVEITSNLVQKMNLHIDATIFVEKNIQHIKGYIKICESCSLQILESNLKHKIQEMLLDREYLICPVTGGDIMNIFKVEGKEIAPLHEKAKNIFQENPYIAKEELIEKLLQECS